MECEGTAFDYHGALVVVETERDKIVLIHPLGGSPEAPASLPSDPCQPGEEPTAAAVRILLEKTGLDVLVVREFVTLYPRRNPDRHRAPTVTWRASRAANSLTTVRKVRRGRTRWTTFPKSCPYA